MGITKIGKKVLSSDKEHELSGHVYIPEGEPKGLFHVVHGMTEHISRYDGFMNEMAENGYIVFGYDNLGHGDTARDDSELGYIAKKDGWKRLVEDVHVFGEEMRQEYGSELPYILMGHSMGSFIVRLTATEFNFHDKLIVMGTGGPNPAAGAGLAVIGLTKKLRGERHVSPMVEKMAFGTYNERFGDDDKYSWLTKDKEVRDRYREDKFCTFHFTSSAMGDLIKLNSESNKKTWAAGMDKKKPVLLVSGSEDPVGSYGEGVKKVCEMLKEEGVPVEMKLYPDCRHEILNDSCRGEVIKDILAFCE